VANVHALLAAGVNADGHREILGLQVTSAEDGAGWLAFFRDLTARGLAGVALVTSDAHRGLVNLIAATCTHTGLRVDAALDTSTYPLGVSISTERLKALPIAPHLERGTWNYTIHPAEQGRQAASGPGQRQRARAAALHDLADPRLTGMSRRELEDLAAELAPCRTPASNNATSNDAVGPAARPRASTAGPYSPVPSGP
jgi:hypothetical protein